jgi:hypothetical protein
MQFKPRAQYADQPRAVTGVAKVEPPVNDTARGQLAQAIRERERARAAVDDARAAEHAARIASFEAKRHADTLRAEVDKPKSDGDVIAAISGGVDDVIALERPATEIRAAIALADQKAAAWRNAADQAEQAIPVRERALAEAEDRVKQCAVAVLASVLDVTTMLKDARDAADWIVNQRAGFLYLMSILPDGPIHQALADFMRRAWLIGEFDEAWRRNPSIKPFADALARLKADAEAEISAP